MSARTIPLRIEPAAEEIRAEDDALAAAASLRRVFDILHQVETPTPEQIEALMAEAQALAATSSIRALPVDEVERERQRATQSPLTAEERAWLCALPPMQDTLSDLIQGLCVAKAHVAIDPAYAKALAGSVCAIINHRISMGEVDFVRRGLKTLAQATAA